MTTSQDGNAGSSLFNNLNKTGTISKYLVLSFLGSMYEIIFVEIESLHF